MAFNQKIFLGMMIICILAAESSLATAQDGSSESDSADSDKQFLNDVTKLYRDTREIDKFAQFSKPWRQGTTASAKSPLTKAREQESLGKYLGACADYLVVIRDAINSKGPSSSITPYIDSLSQLLKKLDKDSQRTVCKAMVDFAVDSKRYSFAREHNKDLESILILALKIKDELRDQDEQLIVALMEVAGLYAADKDYQAAIDKYKRALALIIETKLDDDSKLMSCVNSLSTIYSSQQNQKQAENMLKGVLSALDAGQAASSKLARVPYLLRLYTIYKQAGKTGQAAETVEKVITIVDDYNSKPITKADSKLASSVAEQMKSSSWGYGFHSGSYEDEKLLKCAFKFKLKVNGFGPWVAFDLASLGQMLSRAGKNYEAIDLYKISIATAEDLDDQQTAELLQQRLLNLLNNSEHQSEKAQLEEKLKKRKDQKNQELYRDAVQRLTEIKSKGNSDQNALLEALLSAASTSLEVHKKSDARSYLDEAISILKKSPAAAGHHDSSLNQLWVVTRAFLAHSDSKEDEHIVYVVAEFDEQRHSNNARILYSAMDLPTIVRYFLDKQKPGEAEEFVKYVLELRKHYRPSDIESLVEANNQLRVIYSLAQFQSSNKLADVLGELVKLNESKYGPNDVKTINERTALAILLVRQNKGEMVDKTLVPVLIRARQLSVKGKDLSQEETNEINQITSKLSQIADAYMISGNMLQAEKYVRHSLEMSLIDEYHTGASSDRIIRNLLNSGQFMKASEFIQLRLNLKEKVFGSNSFEAAQQRLQLSEVYFRYSRQLGMQGKKAPAKEWSDKSELAFKQALQTIQSTQGADSVAAKDAIKKRELMLNPVVPNVQSGDDVT